MPGERWSRDTRSSAHQYGLETSEGMSRRRNSSSGGFSVCVGCCDCCCFLLCFLQLSILLYYSRAAWELLKKKMFPPPFRSKREYTSSKMEVKHGVQRYEPPGLRYMGKLLSPPSLLFHHPSELRSIQVSWPQIWLVSGETMPLFWCWQTSASLII